LESWLNRLLAKKLINTSKIDSATKDVQFRHIDLPLKIVASNISTQRMEIYSKDTTPEMPVAHAVSASASIPFFFVPSRIGDGFVLDGGLLSNFPAWLFDAERRRFGPQVPTLGFRLVPELASEAECAESFAGRLAYALVAGDSSLEVREVENLHIIPLKVRVEATSFQLSIEELDRLYESGRTNATNYLKSVYGPKDPSEMTEALRVASRNLLDLIGRDSSAHLRANIALPTTRGTLRIMYCFGMDKDPDDRLEFEVGSGACGTAWRERNIVVCDLTEAKKTYATDWKMNKYQQAMVCQDLKSLLCIPIFEPINMDMSAGGRGRSLIGVLNFDSKEDLLIHFENNDLTDGYLDIAAFVAEFMRGAVVPAERENV
jgi:NTE family protein